MEENMQITNLKQTKIQQVKAKVKWQLENTLR